MKTICLSICCFLFLTCKVSAQANSGTPAAREDILVEKSPVSTIAESTSFCWSLCSNSFIESELLRLQNQRINLSEQFLIRKLLEEKVSTYLLLKGQMEYNPEGELPDVFTIIEKHGAIPQSGDEGKIRPASELIEMIALLNGLLDGVLRVNGNSGAKVWETAFKQTLNLYLGQATSFKFDGRQHTANSFARENILLQKEDYIQLTSWLHYPFYQECILRTPNNWALNRSINLPLTDFMEVVDSALYRGIDILWSGDISEAYFSWEDGLAYVPNKSLQEMTSTEQEELFLVPLPEKEVDATHRQQDFDNFTTNSDFIMQVVGKVADQGERKWYLFKNACDLNEDEVFMYISKNYFKLKTVSILVHKDAVPDAILKKIK